MSSSIPSKTDLLLLKADPSLLAILSESYPSIPLERAVPIALEAARQRERLSSIPFYANRAAKDGNAYWIRMAISYRGDD